MDVVRELIAVARSLVGDSKEEFDKNKSKLLKEFIQKLEKSAKSKIAQIARRPRHYVQEGTVINRKLWIRDFVIEDIAHVEGIYRFAPRGALSKAAKKVSPIRFKLPVKVGDQIFEGEYEGKVEVFPNEMPSWRGEFEYTIRAELTNASEIAREAPDPQVIDDLLKDLSSQLYSNFDELVQKDVTQQKINPELEYHIEPAQRGGYTDPSWDAHVDEAWLEPDEYDFVINWDDVATGTGIQDEIDRLADEGVDVDLEDIARKVLKGIGSFNVYDIDTNTVAHEVNGVARVKKVDRAGVHYEVELILPDSGELHEAIMESIEDFYDPY
jgi:hypothetical protein